MKPKMDEKWACVSVATGTRGDVYLDTGWTCEMIVWCDSKAKAEVDMLRWARDMAAQFRRCDRDMREHNRLHGEHEPVVDWSVRGIQDSLEVVSRSDWDRAMAGAEDDRDGISDEVWNVAQGWAGYLQRQETERALQKSKKGVAAKGSK